MPAIIKKKNQHVLCILFTVLFSPYQTLLIFDAMDNEAAKIYIEYVVPPSYYKISSTILKLKTGANVLRRDRPLPISEAKQGWLWLVVG